MPIEKIAKDDLLQISRIAECMNLLAQEIAEEFFNKYDPEKKEDNFGITYDFRRNRILFASIEFLIFDLIKELNKLKINYF